MIIHIADIPQDGLLVNFLLDKDSLYERINAIRAIDYGKVVLPPEYKFVSPPSVELKLQLRGSTVMMDGKITGTFICPCSRCAEDIESSMSINIHMALKPSTDSADNNDEDIGFGYYTEKQVNCENIAQEYLILNIPHTVTCSAASVNECPRASEHIKSIMKKQTDDSTVLDDRFSMLRKLKVDKNGDIKQ